MFRSLLLVGVLAGVASSALSLSPAAAQGRTTTVQPNTRILLADGEPLVVKGFNYGTNPVGGHWSIPRWYMSPAVCMRDAGLMRTAGVTMIRLYFTPTQEGPKLRQCLDHFHAAGIGVAWTLPARSKLSSNPAWIEAYWTEIQLAVQEVGSHPATLLWLIGNELELTNACDAVCNRLWFGSRITRSPGLLNELARRLSGADPRHLVGTSVAGCFNFRPNAAFTHAYVPELDFWGLNLYPGRTLTQACGENLWEYLNQADARPKILTEMGADRYECRPTTAEDYTTTCLPGSGENQAAQQDWLASLWQDMQPNLATTGNPLGAISGGLVFMWTDSWDKCDLCTGWTHDVVGRRQPIPQPDGIENLEFWGVTPNSTDGAFGGAPRPTSLGFDALAALWTGIPRPSLTDVNVQPDASCRRATVTWRTDERSSSEVYAGVEIEVRNKGGAVIADNTIYTLRSSDPRLTTSHRMVIDLPSVAGSGAYRIQPRVFTADWRSKTVQPIRLKCP